MPNLETYFRPDDYASHWWGEVISPKLIDVIATSPRDRLLEFAEAVVEVERSVPRMTPGMLRPLVALGDSAGDKLIAGDGVTGVSRVRALSLYAHQVGVWDPLPMELQLIIDARDSGENWNTGRLRTALTAIHQLTSLADAEIVVWIPNWSESFDVVMHKLGRILTEYSLASTFTEFRFARYRLISRKADRRAITPPGTTFTSPLQM